MEIDSKMISKDEDRSHCRYNLYGVINHSGLSISSGHYIAICYDETNGWVKYNDSFVSEMS